MKHNIDVIAEIVNRSVGKDILVFDPPYLQKMLAKRVEFHSFVDTTAYIEFLESNLSEVLAFYESLLNTYTTFFRNPLTFAYLEQVLFPAMISQRNHTNSAIRIWSSGCATGQEAYSIAMILDEVISRMDSSCTYSIFATDVSSAALETARLGRYQNDGFLNLRMRQRDDYFEPRGDAFEVSSRIKEHVDFSYYDMLNEGSVCPPPCIYGDLDLAFCSNVLFYYRRDVRAAVIRKLHRCLSPEGYFISDEAEREDILSSGIFDQTAAFLPVFSPIIAR
ncbi:MAG: CheR family methyltransferase [Bacteroidota bacterium]